MSFFNPIGRLFATLEIIRSQGAETMAILKRLEPKMSDLSTAVDNLTTEEGGLKAVVDKLLVAYHDAANAISNASTAGDTARVVALTAEMHTEATAIQAALDAATPAPPVAPPPPAT